jgi:cation:H+ antiporter
MDFLLLVLGIGLLYAGGEGLVRGAAHLGRRLGLSPMVIGLTIVSMGTSSPELAASLAGVFQGAPAVALGNIIGSNIANLSLVLGVTGAIWPLAVAARFIQREVPFMLLTSALVFPIVWDSRVSRLEGAALLAILVIYLISLLWKRAPEDAEVSAEFDEAFGDRWRSVGVSLLMVVAGIGLLVAGAQALIQGAVGMARSLGVGERVIGLTVVAFGTSLPELASSLVAAARKEGDIVIGNLIGSNVFNILFILGTTAAVRPVAVVEPVWTDLIVMVMVSLVVWRCFGSGSRLSRAEAIGLVVGYCAYVVALFIFK